MEHDEIGNNPTRSRDHNRKIILDLLRQHGQLGRKELAAMARLSPPAVGNILDTLLSQELILDMGRLRLGRGQPALQFAINPKGAHTLGFEIGVKGIIGVALDLGGNPIDKKRFFLNECSPERCLAILREEQSRIAQKAPGELLGIGIVMPGPFVTEGMAGVGPTTLPVWETLTPEILTDTLNTNVFIENDANAAALAEALFGTAARLRDFAMLYFGEGVGLGIISAGRLFRGSFGNAGEIGHIQITADGLPCACGQHGCLERYVSRHALGESLSPGAVTRLWEAGNSELNAWIARAGHILTPIIALIENLLDPQTIVIGGQLPAPVIDAIMRHIRLGVSVAARKDRTLPRLIRGDTGSFTAALGAAALPFYDTITPFS